MKIVVFVFGHSWKEFWWLWRWGVGGIGGKYDGRFEVEILDGGVGGDDDFFVRCKVEAEGNVRRNWEKG
ncbi:hypothetical protein [Paenibacillus sp. Y412MC10]|uniref:hypothetical protein n=1 Tax=Geobacillus sp. (strain Y412MC10) TaxID=481743 RepID=UPI0011A29B91|nr:hypothetical protein [Paenibacillus sp. Y412MC10]